MENEKVEVSFTIRVQGMVGGSFEIDKKDFERIKERWESRPLSHEETDLADELLSLAPFDYMRYLNIEDMEIEDLDSAQAEGDQE